MADTVGYDLLSPSCADQGSSCLVCVVVPPKSDILALSSWKDGCVAGKREAIHSWVLLTESAEIEMLKRTSGLGKFS